MNYSFKKEYKLIQQTPIIHFQHEQHGAILRATELKPKLDRFIILKNGGKDDNSKKKLKKDHKDWFISPSDNDALNYKIKISVSSEPRVSADIPKATKINELIKSRKPRNPQEKNVIIRSVNNEYENYLVINGMYFGNQGNIKKYKKVVLYTEPVTLEIICFNKELLAEIDKYIHEFFCITNFGTRQSKGFGDFIVLSTSNEQYINALKENFTKVIQVKGNSNEADELMKYAQIVYSVMKAGINNVKDSSKEGGYVKGFAVREFLSNDTGSEKAFIKNKDLAKDRDKGSHDTVSSYNSYIFIRALLGLGDSYSYKRNGGGKPQKVHVYNVDGLKTPDGKYFCDKPNEYKLTPKEIEALKEKNNEIDRFRSPVTIKISPNHKSAFLCFDDSYKCLLGKTFVFLNELLSEGYILKTPDEFDLETFANNFSEYYNLKKSALNNTRAPFNKGANIETKVIK